MCDKPARNEQDGSIPYGAVHARWTGSGVKFTPPSTGTVMHVSGSVETGSAAVSPDRVARLFFTAVVGNLLKQSSPFNISSPFQQSPDITFSTIS